MARFGPNVVSFLIMSGSIRWYIVGSCVTPNDVPDVHFLEQALQAEPKGLEMILMVGMNARMVYPHYKCE